MKCPCCGTAELMHDTRDMPYTTKGETTRIPAVEGDFCPACGEVLLNREHGDRYSECVGLFQRRVNADVGRAALGSSAPGSARRIADNRGR
jgi:HTH-type transcriptional regulator / antitoxin MqsA